MMKGKYVKCLLSNSTTIEGIVNYWGNHVSLTEKDENEIIIFNPSRDIVLVKMCKEKDIHILEKDKSETEDKFQEEYNKSSDDPNRLKSLAKLKEELIDQEKQIVANKLKDHHIAENKINKYPKQFNLFKK